MGNERTDDLCRDQNAPVPSSQMSVREEERSPATTRQQLQMLGMLRVCRRRAGGWVGMAGSGSEAADRAGMGAWRGG
jgi:hypothetical protein